MVHICFLAPPGGRLLGFSISGHAAWGEEGTDIVCAAVSSAAYLVANTVTDVLAVKPASLKAGEGELSLQISREDEPLCRALFQGLWLHFGQLVEQYPEHVEVHKQEFL